MGHGVEDDLAHNKMGSVFRGIKLLAGTNSKSLGSSLHKADRTPCNSESEILERWREHFETALNHSTGTPSAQLDTEAENATVDTSTTIDEPTLSEVIAAIHKLKNGRAPGSDGIPAMTSLRVGSSTDVDVSTIALSASASNWAEGVPAE